MVEQLQFQPIVIELCGLGHLLLVVGNAGDLAEVAMDDPADSGGAADAEDRLSLSLGIWFLKKRSLHPDLVGYQQDWKNECQFLEKVLLPCDTKIKVYLLFRHLDNAVWMGEVIKKDISLLPQLIKCS